MQIRTILLIIFASTSCVWLFTDTRAFKERLMRVTKPAGIVAAFFQLIVIAFQILQPTILPFPTPFYHPVVSVIGLIVYVLGALFAAWGRLSMGKSWGVPAQHEIDKQKNLVTTGPFKYSRNPIYVGLLVMFIGFELALRSWLILLAIPLYYFIKRAIQTEEKLLEHHFEKEYMNYKKEVRWFL